MAKSWGADERARYNYGPGPHPIELMHFTQMVWRDTRTVGCARKKCMGMNIFAPHFQPWYVVVFVYCLCGGGALTSGRYTVCEYFPPGNYQQLFVQMVPRPV